MCRLRLGTKAFTQNSPTCHTFLDLTLIENKLCHCKVAGCTLLCLVVVSMIQSCNGCALLKKVIIQRSAAGGLYAASQKRVSAAELLLRYH